VDRKDIVLERLDVAALVADLFPRLDRAGVNQVLVSCPVHEDQHASCSVNTSTGLWNCKACGAKGAVFDLYMAARGVDFSTALHDLEARAGIVPPVSAGPAKRRPASPLPVKPSPAKPATAAKSKSAPRVKGKTVAVYRYFDAAGVCRYLKRRIEPGRNGRKKEFAFAHFLPDGTEAPGLGDNAPLLYGLPALATAPHEEMVFVVEGEKCQEAMASLGFVAVSSPYGAQSKWPLSFIEYFAGRTVVLLPDNDLPGEGYAAGVAAALLPVAACVKVLRLPNLPPKGDVCDWLDAQRKGAAADA
jgi:DNA primase